MLLGPGDLGVARPAARRDDEGVGGDASLLALLVHGYHRPRVDEAGVGVVVLDLVTDEVRVGVRARARVEVRLRVHVCVGKLRGSGSGYRVGH